MVYFQKGAAALVFPHKTLAVLTNLTAGFILFFLNVSLITSEKLEGAKGEWLSAKHV